MATFKGKLCFKNIFNSKSQFKKKIFKNAKIKIKKLENTHINVLYC
jgi:hypothetical protein